MQTSASPLLPYHLRVCGAVHYSRRHNFGGFCTLQCKFSDSSRSKRNQMPSKLLLAMRRELSVESTRVMQMEQRKEGGKKQGERKFSKEPR
jgi:hypothetical protein